MGEVNLSSPEPLADYHNLKSFDCGDERMNVWLKNRARTSNCVGGSRIYVTTCGSDVKGYYSLAAGSVERNLAPGRVRRNMPDPVPVILLARLAVDKDFQGHGVGRALLRDAIVKTIQAADIIGIRAILVHALNERAKEFYMKLGFMHSGINNLSLMLPLQIVQSSLDL